MTNNIEARNKGLELLIGSVFTSEAEARVKNLSNYHGIGWRVDLDQAAYASGFRGIGEFFVNNDPQGLKQWFYVATRLFMTLNHYRKPGLVWREAFPAFQFGLLSDSPEIYSALGEIDLSDKGELCDTPRHYHHFQLVLRHDDVSLQRAIELVNEEASRRRRSRKNTEENFFTLLLNKDKDGLERLIERNARRKYHDSATVNEFLAGLAVIEAKLCWYRGIEVQIDHPRVPMALLPIRPLPEYDPVYDCLRPGWEPPPPPPPPSKSKLLVDKVTRGLKQFVRTGTFG